MDELARVLGMSMQVVAAIDNPESMTSAERVRLILSRDAMLRKLTAEEQRLHRLWAEQEPS